MSIEVRNLRKRFGRSEEFLWVLSNDALIAREKGFAFSAVDDEKLQGA